MLSFDFLLNCHSNTSQNMFNLDDITNEHNIEHNKKWPYIPDYPYRILIIGGSGSRKTNALLNLITEQDSDNLIDKIYLYKKDLIEPKYEFLIKKRENEGIKHLNDPKAFIERSDTMDDIYNSIDDYNPTRKRKVLIVFDDIIINARSSHSQCKVFFLTDVKIDVERKRSKYCLF